MNIVVLPGDGIGPDIVAATIAVLEALNDLLSLKLTLEQHEIGFASLRALGTTFPASVLERCRSAEAIILGPVSSAELPPREKGGINASRELRVELDLYANVRPSRSRAGVASYGRTPVDLVIVRENTEGFYADRNMFVGVGEFMPTPDLALAVRKITRPACNRIARMGFEIARERPGKSVTAVHKANVLRLSDGLFLEECRAVARDFPDVRYKEQLVDSMAALLIRCPHTFDVIVTTNMFGDILSDQAAELAGSLGLGGSVNVGERHCMAQAAHGSAPDIAGKDKANPSSLILSVAMMLDWLGRRHDRLEFKRAGQFIHSALDALIADPARRTVDLGGTLGTKAFTAGLCHEIAQQRPLV